ncbi:MAG: leucine-rich repeat domain-containing protein [Bacillota bacterium]|nr:leucine-rich repeat domain-containing protein [Bacillota bacterium]
MNQEYMYQYKIKSDNSAILYRIYGTDMNIVLPKEIDGHPLSEIGPYCFSASNHIPKDVLCTTLTDNLYELCGNQVESVEFPNTIRSIGSHAFYNCKNLKQITISSSLQELGYDAFVNATKLHDIYIQEHSSTPTIIRYLLRQITWDVDIHFQDQTLFYPEYYEVYDEIGPAHIFGMNIQGEGFRLRQCIKNDIVHLEEYDSVFEKLCIEESPKTLMHFALIRSLQKPDLYKTYILEHQKDLLKIDLELSVIEHLLKHQAITKESFDTLLTQSESPQRTTQLIAWKKKYFSIQKSTYSFEDF